MLFWDVSRYKNGSVLSSLETIHHALLRCDFSYLLRLPLPLTRQPFALLDLHTRTTSILVVFLSLDISVSKLIRPFHDVKRPYLTRHNYWVGLGLPGGVWSSRKLHLEELHHVFDCYALNVKCPLGLQLNLNSKKCQTLYCGSL